MSVNYVDIGDLSQKSTVAGTEKLPVSDTQYITPSMIRDGWLALAGGTMTGAITPAAGQSSVDWSAKDLTLAGNIYLANNNTIYFKDRGGTNRSAMQGYSSSSTDSLLIGYGYASASINSFLDGYNVNLRYGTSHTTGLTLNNSGNVVITNGLTVNGNAFRAITVSSSDPTSAQGQNGDIWIKI